MIQAVFAKYALPAVGVLAIALGGFAVIRDAQAKRYKAEAAAAVQTADGLLGAVTSKDTLIQQLTDAMARTRTLVADQQARTAAAALEIDSIQQTLDLQRATLRRSEDRDRQDPECAALLGRDIGAVCPGFVDSLRERAVRGLQRPGR